MVKSFPTTETKKLLYQKIHFVSFMTLIMFDYETAIVKKLYPYYIWKLFAMTKIILALLLISWL